MSKPITLSRAFADGVTEEMTRDPSIFVIGTDIFIRGGHFAQLKGLGELFGRDRIRDAPISEAAMVAAGVGAAMAGMRPIIDLNFTDFALGAMDEIINQAAKMRFMSGKPVPLVIRGTSGTALFAAQHNNSLDALWAQTPGLLVAAPSTPQDAKGLIKSALRGEDPVIYLMHKRLAGTRGIVDDDVAPIPFGEAAIRRTGEHLTIVSYGINVPKALKAAEQLATQGIECEIIDLRTLYPIDYDRIIASVERTGRAMVVTEEPAIGGIAAELMAAIQANCFAALRAPVSRVGAAYSPIPHSPQLMESYIPQVEGIIAAATQLAHWN